MQHLSIQIKDELLPVFMKMIAGFGNDIIIDDTAISPKTKNLLNMLHYSELIKTIITDPIAVADELWLFKIEIFKHTQKGYFAQLWRLDTYDIKPTFALQKDWVASESFFIDDGFRFDGLGLYGDDLRYFASSDDCQNYVLKCIDDTFNVS